MSNCELVLLEDEVNPVISVALKSGLDVTGLGPAALSMQPTLFAVNLNAEGTYRSLGAAFRNVFDEVRRIRAENRQPTTDVGAVAAPLANAIDPDPLNRVLSIHGTAVDGVYRAAIGRLELPADSRSWTTISPVVRSLSALTETWLSPSSRPLTRRSAASASRCSASRIRDC